MLGASLWAMAWMLYSHIDRSVWQTDAVDRNAFPDERDRHLEGVVGA